MTAVVERDLDELRHTIASGEAILFTGAGFSSGMRDRKGRPLPSSEEMAAELWSMVFGGEPRDASSLADLFDVAMHRDPAVVARYLEERLTVGDDDVPGHLVAWLTAPWRRIYTLNVDDVERAARRHARLPCRLVHLNGMVGGDLAEVTFSTLQYAARLCKRQPSYEHLAEDLERAPFVFVGTTLDEVVLWQHVMDHARRGRAHHPPRSFLVTRAPTRARALLLESFGIRWLPMTVDAAAKQLFP